ncbi:hypothetical protein [Flavobacterium rhizosphaerae]|uniref:DUF4870 domain-containing protein n=1 Tax=Flavobacterium rhizosphaerae TaxID=3163298 RepID=A0ABW8YW59_9FLAO
MTDNSPNKAQQLYEYEEAGNAYLMAVVTVIAGVPLPVINIIAALIYYLAKRKASYFVRWHSLQALLAQCIVIPFNSIALLWTINIISSRVILNGNPFGLPKRYYTNISIPEGALTTPSALYWAYLAFVLFLNIFEFIAVISTAAGVRKGKKVRWFVISGITDLLCSKQNRDPYTV